MLDFLAVLVLLVPRTNILFLVFSGYFGAANLAGGGYLERVLSFPGLLFVFVFVYDNGDSAFESFVSSGDFRINYTTADRGTFKEFREFSFSSYDQILKLAL